MNLSLKKKEIKKQRKKRTGDLASSLFFFGQNFLKVNNKERNEELNSKTSIIIPIQAKRV